ncbi:MAG TPA: hypothetical protein VN750_11050 [Steroidobacteraceae bacterium]|nr:hypothetical protein [Steroidobacteraceae bacterium]
MKKSDRPAWMGPSRRTPEALPAKPSMPPPTDQAAAPEAPPTAKGSSRGYNPYDTVNTRFPDVWHAKPKRS